MPTFQATLSRFPGKGGWTFAPVPAEHVPSEKGAWGRTPVHATVDGRSWDTSVWTDKTGCFLPVPKKIRRGKEVGDTVAVSFELR